MMQIDDLETLARAATQPHPKDKERKDCVACEAQRRLGKQGERILALLAVVRAATAMRDDIVLGHANSLGDRIRLVAAFDSALAKLDALP